MIKSEWVRLQHMLEAAEEAVNFVNVRTRAELDNNRMLCLALVKLIETIGEAANSIAVTTRQSYPQIPWIEIIGMRHRLIHGYYEIDLNIVWEVITHDLPPLIIELRKILSEQNLK